MRKPLKNCCSYCTDFSLLKWGVDISCWETCPKLSLEDFYEVMLQSVCVCKWCSSISDGCQWWQISSNEIESSQQGSIIILHSNSSLFMKKWQWSCCTYLKYFKTAFLYSVWQEKSISKNVQICLWTCINYPIRWEISLMTDGV